LVIARPFIKSKYIGIVNLLADRELMPEYLTDRDVSDELASWAVRWLNDSDERENSSKALAELRERVAFPGATDRAASWIAEVVASELSNTTKDSDGYRGPHRCPELTSTKGRHQR
jgi:lipid-A-disaccharide synthase